MTSSTITDPDLLLHRLRAELVDLRHELAACRGREAAALSAARIDALTGLPNRRQFDQHVGQQIDRHAASRGRLALLFVDLDGFKAINDLHGHAVGDALLKLVGLRLRHSVRQHDLVCRVGGDEFVCVLFDLRNEGEAQAVERKVAATVAQRCFVGDLTLSIRPSIGAALFPRDGASAPALLAHADQAMYRNKRQRRLAPPRATPVSVAGPSALLSSCA